MTIYESKTGYVKRTSTGECYEAKTIYCPDGADLSVYADISQADYEAYRAKQEAEMVKLMEERQNG